MYSEISGLKFLIKLTPFIFAFTISISSLCAMGPGTNNVTINFSHTTLSPIAILEKIRDSEIDTVILDKPGNYTLIGKESFDDKDNAINDLTAIPIKSYNRIYIKGHGVYNIVLKNVNIKPKCFKGSDMRSPFSNDCDAEINLTLIGNNLIHGSYKGEIGLSINGSLTITDESTGRLDVVSDGDCAIYADNITIKNGNVKAISELVGIYGLCVSIEGGNVVATSSTTAIYGVNKLKLTNCNIKTPNVDALYPEVLPGLTSNSDIEIIDGVINGIKY